MNRRAIPSDTAENPSENQFTNAAWKIPPCNPNPFVVPVPSARNDSMRCSGTYTSSTTSVLDPVPRRAATNQSSWMR